MSTFINLPLSNPGPLTGRELHDHQKIGLSKLLFMENDYRSLFESMVRHDPSIKDLTYLDLSSFPHLWKHEGNKEWSNPFSERLGEEESRPLQGKGMILADEMGTGKSLTILALIEASWLAAREWRQGPLNGSEEPSYRLPLEYDLEHICIDKPPTSNPTKLTEAPQTVKQPSCTNTKSSSSNIKSAATLIICPKSVIGVWENLILKHWKGRKCIGGMWGTLDESDIQQKDLRVYKHYDNQLDEDPEPLSQAGIVLTTYEAIKISENKSNVIRDMTFYRVILDEGHRVRNVHTNLHEQVHTIKKRHIHIVSGTPVQISLTELHAYARLFDLPCGLASLEYMENEIIEPAMHEYPGPTRLRQFCDIWCLRRLKSDIKEIDLPPKTIKVFFLSNQLLSSGLQGIEDRKTEGWDSEAAHEDWYEDVITKKGWWEKRFTPLTSKGSIKMKWFKFFLQNYRGDKLVVFHHWKVSAKVAKKVLEEEQYCVQYLTADMTTKERNHYVHKFNTSTGTKICLLASMKVGGEGLSMVGANTCIFADLWWNPAVHDQAMDRLHRAGQKNSVTVLMPVTDKTYEEGIWIRQDYRRGSTNLMFPRDPEAKLPISRYPQELREWLKNNDNHDEDEESE
ncbi:uncharacterized protein I206_104930 [Kwoniella pini CBS 10737]|uniref:Uncharacterized protein n=1 Tax=Kwoniella pini CBS 10737 TaxID=1296096 RepID=A0A1B9I897_9TREE|nr:uncharacterized protein I206_02471 [Kwoniella pini CBS 10737]OCF51755.1 hypothetical protein I206_02471 [Kwoniella pini CBS 10737]